MSQEIRHRIYNESGFDFSAQICDEAAIDDLDDNAVENFRQRWIEKSGKRKSNFCQKSSFFTIPVQ